MLIKPRCSEQESEREGSGIVASLVFTRSLTLVVAYISIAWASVLFYYCLIVLESANMQSVTSKRQCSEGRRVLSSLEACTVWDGVQY